VTLPNALAYLLSSAHCRTAAQLAYYKAAAFTLSAALLYFPPPQWVRRGADAVRYGLQGLIIISAALLGINLCCVEWATAAAHGAEQSYT
jgi:hypothetical protein